MFRAPFFVVLSGEKRGGNSQKSRKIAQNRASGVFRACSKRVPKNQNYGNNEILS